MKTESSIAASSAIHALAKGTCPICVILKDYQWVLATKLPAAPHLRGCNFQCRTFARPPDSGLPPRHPVTGKEAPARGVLSIGATCAWIMKKTERVCGLEAER